jgi:uncharacterized protein YndB with AHSA1/START domain
MAQHAEGRELPALHLTRTIPASPERVFRAWTDPTELSRWIAPEGVEATGVEIDLRIGGDYRVAFRAQDGEVVYVVGTYLVIDPPRRLSFTWLLEGMDREDTRVTVDLDEVDGATELVLTHEKFVTDGFRAFHEAGWTDVLGRLAALLHS